jgi:hypothetical protein
MLAEDINIQFANFEPSHELRSGLDILLNQLHRKSPNKAFLSATFTLTNGIFEGAINVTSAAGNFVANATDVQMLDLGHKLAEKLLGQLDNWKALRFE